MDADRPPANLPSEVDVEGAPLPQTYERARRHLQRCEQVDEVKDWGDKARALASYAKQADDDELYRMARRIQSRAVRRAGELLREFQQPPEKRLPNKASAQSNGTGTEVGSGPSTQREAAEQAGMSKRQETTARRVAEVPEEEFEEGVESDDPPSVSEWAERGKGGDYLTSEKPEGFRAATTLQGKLRRFAEFCGEHDPRTVLNGMEGRERTDLIEQVDSVTDWLQGLRQQMEA